MKAKTFDEKFDRGEEDIVEYLDLSQARRGELTQTRVNVDFFRVDDSSTRSRSKTVGNHPTVFD